MFIKRRSPFASVRGAGDRTGGPKAGMATGSAIARLTDRRDRRPMAWALIVLPYRQFCRMFRSFTCRLRKFSLSTDVIRRAKQAPSTPSRQDAQPYHRIEFQHGSPVADQGIAV